MELPRISVCITAYNQEQYIRKAIESVLNQTLLPYELLIIDDYSQDETRIIILNYKSKHASIKCLFNSVNIGITKSRNIALKEATGDYLTFLDGDDYFLPNKLEDEVSLLTNGNYDFAYSNFNIINKEDKLLKSWNTEGQGYTDNIFIKTFSLDFPDRTLFRSELVNLSKWRDLGVFDENLALWEDFDMRIRLAKNFKAVYNSNISHVYRKHINGLSTTKIDMSALSIKYIFKKNYSLLSDISPGERKKIQKSIRGVISDSYFLMAYNILSEGKLSVKKILSSLRYTLISQTYCINVKSIISIGYLIIKRP